MVRPTAIPWNGGACHGVHRSKYFLADFGFTLLPLTESIGHRAVVYIEEYGLATGLRAGDAIIAATATENNLPLLTKNARHYKGIRELRLKVFAP
ncbi:MAG: PIN domain-containing protein [candidate division NC10 bacterium]|nr:PIN domain-containing protein [candidate division NC10 bacterium]